MRKHFANIRAVRQGSSPNKELRAYYVPEVPGIASGSGNRVANKMDQVPTTVELPFPAREAECKSVNNVLTSGSAKCHREK